MSCRSATLLKPALTWRCKGWVGRTDSANIDQAGVAAAFGDLQRLARWTQRPDFQDDKHKSLNTATPPPPSPNPPYFAKYKPLSQL